MASRYPAVKVQDYCLNPVHVVKEGVDVYVPCGKCDGCLLHKANEWSQRVGMELECSPNSIFFTLTYSNKYLPTLVLSQPDLLTGRKFWYSMHKDNIRFDSMKDVRRQDGISFLDYGYEFIPLTNSDFNCINYMSKRDVQLWLKLLRIGILKNIYHGDSGKQKDGFFRYFIISEYGPTTFRGHAHGIIFAKSHEISEYLLDCGLYENWKMCDKSRFSDYAHYCDSGARGYVTQYLTCSTKLPKVYQQNKDIRPFRLSSKSPSIGYIQFDKEEVCQELSKGNLEYSRTIPRSGVKAVLMYPKNFAITLYPKCYKFNTLDFSGVLSVYERLWREVFQFGKSYNDVSLRLRQELHFLDWQATKRCFEICLEQNWCPETYVWSLINYYYKRDMFALQMFYGSFDVLMEDVHYAILQYSNFYDVVLKAFYDVGIYRKVLDYFLEGFGLSVDFTSFLDKSFYYYEPKLILQYKLEVEGIIEGMTKTAKMNEILGVAPTCIT